jgi:hypothetical protein
MMHSGMSCPREQLAAALEAVAFALDDAEQPRGEAFQLAQVAQFARYEQQALLHGVLDVVDDAVELGVAPQVLARPAEHALERAAVARAGRFQVAIDEQ